MVPLRRFGGLLLKHHPASCPTLEPRRRRALASGWEFRRLPSREEQVLLGVVSYDPAVSTIWEKMRSYINSAGCPFDFQLFTNYEQQVAALLDGRIDIAWNGPVAHVLTQRHAGQGGTISLGMRDVDRDFVSHCVARRDAGVSAVSDVAGKVVATGASDSPQAHIVPLQWLRELGVTPGRVVPFDLDLGKHGDTALGEIAAIEALLQGHAQVGLLSNLMWQRALEGRLQTVDAKALQETVAIVPGERPPVFDHCQFDALAACPKWKSEAFAKAIFAMDIKKPDHKEVMCLEGLREKWMPPREEGYDVVRRALDAMSSGITSGGVRSSGAPPGQRRGFATTRAQHLQGCSASVERFFVAGAQWRGLCASASSARAPTVGVVGGGGVAGLQTIRALRAKGFQVTAFERAPKIGGVWRGNYLNFGVQVPKQLYEFPDFPFKSVPWGGYPSGPQVQQYIEDYADHFRLRDAVELEASVESVVPDGDGWTFTVRKGQTAARTERFDYCVVATGLYSEAKKRVPVLPGSECFKGQVLHSGDFRLPEQVEGKRVVVVGGGKSAIDCAVEASKIPGTKVTLLSRQPHWPTPRKIGWLIPFQYIFLSRLGQALVIGHRGPLPDSSPAHMSLWHKLGWPAMAAAFTAVEVLFAAQFRNMSGKLSPLFKSDVVSDFYGFAHVLDYQLRNLVGSGKIEWKLGAADALSEHGLQVGEETMNADVVIFGTGFMKDYSIFPADVQAKLGYADDGLYLWRHTIPPHVPRLAFVGSEVATISNIMTHSVQAAWLGKLWSGEIAPVRTEDMDASVEELRQWKRQWMPATPGRSSLVLLHQIHFHDRLLKDMRLNPFRKSPNFFAEAFMPYEAGDYDGVVGA